jgi:heme/copper-type cytochrome/quinol oxidase subunit 4
MFEEIATSAAQLLIIIFGTVIFFIVVYGALWLRASRQAKTE